MISHILFDPVDTSPDHDPQQFTRSNKKSTSSSKGLSSDSDKLYSPLNWKKRGKECQEFPKGVDGGDGNRHGHVFSKVDYGKKAPTNNRTKVTTKSGKRSNSFEPSSPPSAEDVSDDVCEVLPERQANGSSQKFVAQSKSKVIFTLRLSLVQVFVLHHYLVD